MRRVSELENANNHVMASSTSVRALRATSRETVAKCFSKRTSCSADATTSLAWPSIVSSMSLPYSACCLLGDGAGPLFVDFLSPLSMRVSEGTSVCFWCSRRR